MEQIPYDLEVQVRKISVERLLTQYWNPEPVREACKLCPDYGKVWSCPPGVPEADAYLKKFSEGFLIGVKVKYPEEIRKNVSTPEEAQQLRNQTYERVKRNLLLILLELEKEFRKEPVLEQEGVSFAGNAREQRGKHAAIRS